MTKALVALHVPSWTSDPEIESLIKRFGDVGRQTRDFALMKIRPTTPYDTRGRYQRIQIIIFSDPTWTEHDTFQRYVVSEAKELETPSDQDFHERKVPRLSAYVARTGLSHPIVLAPKRGPWLLFMYPRGRAIRKLKVSSNGSAT